MPPLMTKQNGGTRTYRITDLRKGDRISGGVFLVEVANFKQTRNQKYFIQLSLRDSTGAIKAVRWEATEELYASFGVDDFLRVSGRVEEFQSQLQLVIDELERVLPETVDASLFLPVSDRDPGEMERELRAAVAEMTNPFLRELVLRVIDDPRILEGLRRCPAGKALHHAYVGGLLEHTCALIAAARAVAPLYQELDRDILYAAAVLHDIGKIDELCYTSNFGYTDPGQLLGHIALGLLIVKEKAAAIPGFPEDLLVQVQHIIASHHGAPEYGALKLPMTAEAMVFHYLDNLDAKLATLRSIQREFPPLDAARANDGAPGKWSDFKPHLSRKVYFPKRESS